MTRLEGSEIRVDQSQLTRAITGTPWEGSEFGALTGIIALILKPDSYPASICYRIPYPPYTIYRDPSWPHQEGVCVLPAVRNKLESEFYERHKAEWEYTALFDLEDVDDPSIIVKDFLDRPGVYTVRAFHGLEIPKNLEELVRQKISEKLPQE